MKKTMYVAEQIGSVPAPYGKLRIVGEVTRGGLGTVWTTRLYAQASDDARYVIYSNSDSDYVPAVRWEGPEHATVMVPCDRVDHFGNPGAYAQADHPLDRLSVRFVYDERGCAGG